MRTQTLIRQMLPLAAQALLFVFISFCLFALPVQADAEKPHAPYTIRDDAGETVTLQRPAQRIIPLYAGMSENLLALGLEDRIIARTVSDDILDARLPAVGTHMRPNLERIAALQPDLVFILEGRQEAAVLAQQITSMHIAVARFRITSFAELFSCIERVGVLTGEEARASRTLDALQKRLLAVRAKASHITHPPKVFFEVRYPNLLGAGGANMLADVIAVAGGINVLAEYPQRMVRLNEEQLILLNPDIYLVQHGAMNKNPLSVYERPHFRTLAAVQSTCVFPVEESLFSRPGPQSVDAASSLADIFLLWQTGECTTR